MRWRRILLLSAATFVAVVVILFGVLQTGMGQRLLFNTVASAASGPERTIRLEGPSGFFPTDLKLARVEIADSKGVWLSANDVALSWSFWPLLSGHVDVQSVRAARLEVIRPPQAPPASTPPAADGSGSVTVPAVSVRSLVVDELRLGAALIGVDSRWRLEAAAHFVGMDGKNDLTLTAARSDGKPGRLSIHADHDGAAKTLRATGDVEEGGDGILAAVLGRPDLPRTTGKFNVQLSSAGGDGQITVEAGDALHVTGSGRVVPGADGRAITVALEVRGGHLPNPIWASALARPAKVDADILMRPTGGGIDIRSLHIATAPLQADATGHYGLDDKRVQLRVSATGGDPALLALLVPGAGWRDLKMEAQASGTLAALDATLSLRAAALTAAPAAARDIDLTLSTQGANLSAGPALRATLTGNVGSVTTQAGTAEATVRDIRLSSTVERTAAGAINLSALDLASSLLKATGNGTLATNGTIAGTVSLDVPDLSALNALTGTPLAGAGTLKAQVAGTLDQPAVTLDGTVRDAAVPNVPPALLAPVLTLAANAALDREGGWRLEKATVASDAMSVNASGSGRGALGKFDVAFAFPRLAALDPRSAGSLRGEMHVDATTDNRTVRLKAQLADARIDRTQVERLGLDLTLALRQDGFDTTLLLDGSSNGQPITGKGQILATAGQRLSIPTFEASLGSTSLSIRDLSVDQTSASGSAHLLVEDLKQFGALAGQPSASGRVELTVVPDPSAGDGRLKLTLRGTGLGWGGAGVGTLTGDATIADPLGRTTFDATLAATALRGIDDLQTLSLKASGDRTAVAATVGVTGAGTRVDTAVKARLDGSDIAIDIDSLKGSRSGRAFALSQPGHIRIAGGRTVIEPMRLTFGGGQVKVGGTLDPGSSDLALDVTALPLADIAALAGSDVVPTGTLQVQVRVRGATANPHIEATYAIRDARVRTIATASVPAASLTGKATLANNAVNADAGLTIGGGTLRIAATGQLPAPGGTPAGQVKIAGPVDLAMFASLLGPDFRDVGGRALIDVTLATRGGAPSGDGSIRLEGIKLEMPSQGIALSQGSGLIRLAGDRVVIERFGFPAVGRGTLAVSGEIRLDPKLTLPVDLKIEATRARLLNSRELVAQLTSSLRISGSVADGLSLAGTLQIDRAEIGVALGGAAKAVPTVPVREVGTGAPKPVAAAAPSKPIKLDLKISAPQAIFVRGKGMDAELAGDLTVTGDSANPSVLGGLRTRRGTFTFLGRTLNFTRGNVTFISADRIVPILDMLATTRSSSIAVEVTITGKASDPKIVLSSTPQLPQDEIMSHFLFGKAATELGPSQLVQVADALAELTGAGSSGSAIDSVRRGLGLDRLGISQSADQRNSSSTGGNGLSGAGIEGGRYIGRGIYVGGRQGLQGDTRGVVQIEVIPHVKIEGEFGTTSTGRAGVALEYDY